MPSYASSAIAEIFTVSGLAGSRKSAYLKRHVLADAYLNQAKSVIMLPTLVLAKQTHDDLRSLNRFKKVKLTLITSDTTQGSVKEDLDDHLRKTWPHSGEVLIITQQTGLSLPYWHNKSKWNCYVDEVHPVYKAIKLNVPVSHADFTNLVDLSADEQSQYGLITVKPDRKGSVIEMARNKHKDDKFNIYQEVCELLLDPHTRTEALVSSWERLIGNEGGDAGQIHTFSALQPSAVAGFKSVTYLGALLEHSEIVSAWGKSIPFKPHPRIGRRLKFDAHPNGHLVDVIYALEEDWTWNARQGRTGHTLFADLIQLAGQAMSGQKHWLYVINEDVKINKIRPDAQKTLRLGLKIQAKSQGINSYDDIHGIAFLSALNPTPAFGKFLASEDIDRVRYQRSNYLYTLYQAALRLSIRRPDDTNRKTVFVMDRRGADFLAEMLPGCTVTRLGSFSTANPNTARRVWKDDAARVEANRIKAGVLKELRDLQAEFKHATPKFTIIPFKASSELLAEGVSSNDAFIAQLKQAHMSSVDHKDANILISPSSFDIYKTDKTKRGILNVTSVFGIFLDNDGGNLTPAGFRALFPKLRMVLMNTYSGGNRYRAYLPVTQPMTVKADALVKGKLLEVVRAAGFGDPGSQAPQKHGFDLGKLTPSSFFYAPSQAANPADSFFEEHEGEELNPVDWIGELDEEAFAEEAAPKLDRAVASLQAIRAKLQGGGKGLDARVSDAKARYARVPAGT